LFNKTTLINKLHYNPPWDLMKDERNLMPCPLSSPGTNSFGQK